MRADHHHHVATVDHRRRLDGAELGDILGEALQQAVTLLGTRLLATAEQDHGLHLVACLQEAFGALALGLVVVGVDLETETNLLEDGIRLVATRFFDLLGLFIFEFAVVHNFDDRRLGVGSDLDQVQVSFLRKAQCVFDADNADLFSCWSNEADLGNTNPVVRSGIADAISFRRVLPLGIFRHERGELHGNAATHPDCLPDACAHVRRGATDPANLESRSAGGISPLRFRGSGLGARIRLAEDRS